MPGKVSFMQPCPKTLSQRPSSGAGLEEGCSLLVVYSSKDIYNPNEHTVLLHNVDSVLPLSESTTQNEAGGGHALTFVILNPKLNRVNMIGELCQRVLNIPQLWDF